MADASPEAECVAWVHALDAGDVESAWWQTTTPFKVVLFAELTASGRVSGPAFGKLFEPTWSVVAGPLLKLWRPTVDGLDEAAVHHVEVVGPSIVEVIWESRTPVAVDAHGQVLEMTWRFTLEQVDGVVDAMSGPPGRWLLAGYGGRRAVLDRATSMPMMIGVDERPPVDAG